MSNAISLTTTFWNNEINETSEHNIIINVPSWFRQWDADSIVELIEDNLEDYYLSVETWEANWTDEQGDYDLSDMVDLQPIKNTIRQENKTLTKKARFATLRR